MKEQAVLSFLLIFIQSLCGFQDTFFSVLFNHISSMNDQIVIGRCNEDIILPCSFDNEPDVVIHWKNQDNYNVHSYYKGSDHLEKQDPKFANRTSLFHSKIQNGNASLYFRRLSLLDEGIYVCYVGTAIRQITRKVVLKIGAFVTPVMNYKKNNTNSFLVCSVLSVYPRPHITWKMDTAFISESQTEEMGYLGPFSISSTLNITGSNSTYECAIENPLLKQTWTGRWTQEEKYCVSTNENTSNDGNSEVQRASPKGNEMEQLDTQPPGLPELATKGDLEKMKSEIISQITAEIVPIVQDMINKSRAVTDKKKSS
ncbi:HERV-H LTR-associating protein 2 [Heterocephalus glaber]|uniref:HERV-H LTR-associating protein 2 n=1 Tax=Heterocephalus glaber TaxID=10181 RepID=G5CA39_HETGA|nr:HERV-H LTR-associating protein 2 [Heterocephalus glaber]